MNTGELTPDNQPALDCTRTQLHTKPYSLRLVACLCRLGCLSSPLPQVSAPLWGSYTVLSETNLFCLWRSGDPQLPSVWAGNEWPLNVCISLIMWRKARGCWESEAAPVPPREVGCGRRCSAGGSLGSSRTGHQQKGCCASVKSPYPTSSSPI